MYTILPYVHNKQVGGWSVKDDTMGYVFDKMLKYRLVRRVFPAGEVADPDKWQQMIKRQGNIVHIVTNERDIVAVAWLNGISHNHAFAHYCCFPEIWGKDTVTVMRQSLKYWFGFKADAKPMLDIILGRTPASNKLAVAFLKRVGMTVLGEIPDIGIDAYTGTKTGIIFSYIKRDRVLGV